MFLSKVWPGATKIFGTNDNRSLIIRIPSAIIAFWVLKSNPANSLLLLIFKIKTENKESRDVKLSTCPQSDEFAKIAGLNLVELSGRVGIICNGAGLTMATMDLVKTHGGEPANFLDVGGGADMSKVIRALKLVGDNSSVKVILVNILGGITACDEVAKALKVFANENPDRKLIVRLLGNNQEKAKEIMKGTNIKSIDDLNEAVKEAVTLGGKL